MIETLLGMEAETVSNYSLRADQAKELGLHAIAVDIENILTDELSHRDELMMMSQSPTAF
jgi:rubrerythrin